LLDFGACTNAILDNKDHSRKEGRLSRQILDEAGLGSFVDEFVQRLWELERRRPSPIEDELNFHEVRAYREAVVRLCLGTVAATAIGNRCIDEGVRATYRDDDLKILFRIVMQCQIIDDVLDYSRDRLAGLPSFLTGSASLPEAMQLTHQAACAYADDCDLSRSDDVCPLRFALSVGSACAKLIVHLGRWRCGRTGPRRGPS
jgi:hypothetical protein